MNCPYCYHECQNTEAVIQKCPNCGQLVINLSAARNRPHELLKDIVAACGEQIFSDKTRIEGILKDVTPNAIISNLILLAVKNNIHSKLKNINNSIGIDSIKYQFAEQNSLQTERADYIVDSFAFAMGIMQSMGNVDVSKLGSRFGENFDRSNVEKTEQQVEYNHHTIVEIEKKSDVYVAGKERNFAMYWKNGEEQRLNKSVYESEAYSVFVSENDVYVAGKNDNSATLWKNGEKQELFQHRDFGVAHSVFVLDYDMYVAGWYGKFAMLWKNGVAQNLTDGKNIAQANSVFVLGTDVYVAGFERNTQDIPVATLWKNGVAQNLTDGKNIAHANSVFVLGTDVYVAGFERTTQGIRVATLWKNSVSQYLTDGSNLAVAKSVFVLGTDVYVAGFERNTQGIHVATLWKNSVAQRLTDGNYAAKANSVLVTGKDVYVAGTDGKAATLWKNGIVQNPNNNFGEVHSVFVKSHEQIQKEESSHLSRQKIDIEMVFVQGGTFTMGATPEQGDDCVSAEKPAHLVTVSSFFIGKYEITQAQWKAVMGDNDNPSYFKGDNLPVETVSWSHVQVFIQKLNARTGKQYRLPTEAEWEFAARGGNKSQRYKYSGSNNPNVVAWYSDNSEQTTHPVDRKQPNELGIYDMSGNVMEWCSDRCSTWFDGYNNYAQNNPQGAEFGDCHVSRGGCWEFGARATRVSSRASGSTCNYNGFRLACSSN